ncbi:hypothetical protein DL768_004209 [Monosporascus sp. mg162]|nr:hypothetical protein DL768_004209 [Monosporascus sp. mg162]
MTSSRTPPLLYPDFSSILNPNSVWAIETKMYDILTAYLLTPDSQPTPTASALCSLSPTIRQDEDSAVKEHLESFLWELWDLIYRLAERIPFTHPAHQKLADIIAAIWVFGSEPGSSFEAETMSCNPSIMTQALSERLVQLHSDSVLRPNGFDRWESLNGLAARLTALGLCARVSDAVIAISKALERTGLSKGNGANEEVQLEAEMRVMARYVALCGGVVYNIVGDKSFQGGNPWRGERGVARQRWEFWLEKLTDMLRNDGLGDEIRRLAEEALQGMYRAEKEQGT